MAYAALLGAAASLSSGLMENQKDPARMRDNATAFGIATSNDSRAGDAMNYLRGRSGRFGTVQVGALGIAETPGTIGGWATQAAKDDAFAKFTQATGSAAGATPQAPANVSPLAAELDRLEAAQRAAAGDFIARVGSGATTQLANITDPNTGRVVAPISSHTLMLLGAAVIAWLVLRGR